jgi:hypothetical protein
VSVERQPGDQRGPSVIVRAARWLVDLFVLFQRPGEPSALQPRPPEVKREPGMAALTYSVGRPEARDLDRRLAGLAGRLDLHYASETGSGVLLKTLVATVRGKEEQLDSFVREASTWVSNPMQP